MTLKYIEKSNKQKFDLCVLEKKLETNNHY